ncbi:PIG-L family deacetylase [Solihabitans fulvus]|uniref:PIG-L family deacetylase n=1 Tax=Solihabitans fulvus TaxID=1892852 RepID=A0A5B2XFZ7_9PSEU|nr:PIG-L deacetylase family protein [Solihabitans fulvus]KAA2261712.1 PIG-L family deacetylase [Solihabitans fulvus]
MIGLGGGPVREVVALGAHCDDIAIGAGGTLLTLCAARPGLRVHALVCTGGGTAREAEERGALVACCPDADLDVTVLDLPDGLLPARWERVKRALEALRGRAAPDLVLAPNRHDAHQDHRLLAELAPTVFRDHLTLGYEIAKWDGDLGRPTAYQPLTEAVLDEKVALLHEHYHSQLGRDWFGRDTFLGLARLRGVQCRARFAEAFFVDKLTLDLAG